MSHWNTEHWTKVKENYSKKLFCKYISFFFFIFLRFKQIERLKGGVALSYQGLVTKLITVSKV